MPTASTTWQALVRPATQAMAVRPEIAKLSGPKGVAWAPGGSLYLADTESHTIRRIDLKSGIITTIVGTGQRGNGPDGDARQCQLSRPHGIFVSQAGKVYIADSESQLASGCSQ